MTSTRTPARRRPRDAQATRRRILETAERLFVERGYEGARVDEIAARATTNKRMIYVYFGSKEALYLAVLQANFARVLELAQLPLRVGDDPHQQARALIRHYFEFCAANPGFVRLLGWESLEDGRRAGQALLAVASAGLDELHQVLRQGQQRGVFRASLDPRKFIMSINGMCLGYFNQRTMLEFMWDKPLTTPEATEQMLEHILDLAFHGALEPAWAAAHGLHAAPADEPAGEPAATDDPQGAR